MLFEGGLVVDMDAIAQLRSAQRDQEDEEAKVEEELYQQEVQRKAAEAEERRKRQEEEEAAAEEPRLYVFVRTVNIYTCVYIYIYI